MPCPTSRNIRLPALLLILTVLISCEKSYNDESEFFGTWVSDDKADTIMFLSDSTFERNFFSGIVGHYYFDQYEFNCLRDSITIVYRGMIEFLDYPTTHHFELRKDQLTIEVTEDRYGFKKKNYVLLRDEYFSQ